MIENIMKCPNCGLMFEGFDGYTCPHCGKPEVGLKEYEKQKLGEGGYEYHLHTGYKGWHHSELKHGCMIIAAWSKRYIDLIGGREIDSYIILTMNENNEITKYKNDWGTEFVGSPETNPRFGKWDKEYIEYMKKQKAPTD